MKRQQCIYEVLMLFLLNSATGQITPSPTVSPTKKPTQSPTVNPTKKPTQSPTVNPTKKPTQSPTVNPTKKPTQSPTDSPTLSPTLNPTLNPTLAPTLSPTIRPTISPTINPTLDPTLAPTLSPSLSPTLAPTLSPSLSPTLAPTINPTIAPTLPPTLSPTLAPTIQPTISPTLAPTLNPTESPTISPSNSPTISPTLEPTETPTKTAEPTGETPLKPNRDPTPYPTWGGGGNKPNRPPYNMYPLWSGGTGKSGKGTKPLFANDWSPSYVKPKSQKSESDTSWDEQGDDTMIMDVLAITTPSPNHGLGESSNNWAEFVVKPKSAKTVAEIGWFDNNWLNPSGQNGGFDYAGYSSKNSNGVVSIVNDELKPVGIQSSKSAKLIPIGIGQEVVWASKSAKSHDGMSMNDQDIIKVPNGIKVTSKTGKGSYSNHGYISHNDMSVGFYSKSEKSSDTYMSVNPIYTAPKSAKSVSETSSRDSVGTNVRTKSGKRHRMSIDHSKQSTPESKRSKSSSESLNYNEESGEVWMVSKSLDSSSSKSSKSSFDSDKTAVMISPEEAGLPFRAKSSKPIPMGHIHNTHQALSMPIEVSPLNSISKSVQLTKETIIQEDEDHDGSSMILEEYNALDKSPNEQQNKSGVENRPIQWASVLACILAARFLM